jgi:predicted DNA-binding protein with PD1-like motif
MQVKTLDTAADGRRTVAVVLGTGDECMASLQRVVKEQGIEAASFTAIGAFERMTLGYFQWDSKSYKDLPVNEQVEVASLLGNVGRQADGSPKIHAHCVVGTATGEARAGHVQEGYVRPTLEIILEESPAHLARRHDEETGLALIDLEASQTG